MRRPAAALGALMVLGPLTGGLFAATPAQPTAATQRASGPARTAVTLYGAGANAIDPFYEAVFYAYHRANAEVTVNYDPAGSSVGIKAIQQRTVDFGDTEIPMSRSDLARAKGTVLQFPVDLGGVAVSYNIPGVRGGLRLDGPTLAAIFTGRVTNWDSPVIAAVSGRHDLPHLAIVPVHRADSSGPAWDLDAYLLQTAPGWARTAGGTVPSKTWPVTGVGIGEQLNSGVATYVAQTPGAIGYVEYGYALKARFTNVALKNKAGAFVAPGTAAIAAAGAGATGLSSGKFSIVNGAGARTYPLANFSWALLYKRQASTSKGQALKSLFEYVVTTGQTQAVPLGYARLPANAVRLARSTLARLQGPSGRVLPSLSGPVV